MYLNFWKLKMPYPFVPKICWTSCLPYQLKNVHIETYGAIGCTYGVNFTWVCNFYIGRIAYTLDKVCKFYIGIGV